MTAPGQEPDEVMTSKPGGDEEADQLRDLNKIGDNHMPEDLREAEREKKPEDTSEEPE